MLPFSIVELSIPLTLPPTHAYPTSTLQPLASPGNTILSRPTKAATVSEGFRALSHPTYPLPTARPLLPRGYFDSSSDDFFDTSSDSSSDDSTDPSTSSSASYTYTYSQSHNSTYCHESYEEYCKRTGTDDSLEGEKKKWEKWMKQQCWDWNESNGGGGGGGTDSSARKTGVKSFGFVASLACSLLLIATFHP
ncbi:hypothetical protein JCM16303_002316 [Sporobolomyces ruberrimus]